MALSRRLMAGFLTVALTLTACAESDEVVVAPIEGFGGLVAADEPHAAVIGREVLGNGGNAADAAVAMYFALTVTYPSRASLDSGGVCAVFHAETRSGNSLVFLPRTGSGGGGVIPLGPRGMAALQARYGRLRWETLLAPAENMARFGHDMSRALAQDFAVAGPTLLNDPEIRRIFAPAGAVTPGQQIVQPELAVLISAVRQQGAGYVHGSNFVGRFTEASAAVGLPVSPSEMRDAVPAFVDPVRVPAGYSYAYFTPPPAANGLLAGELFAILSEVVSYPSNDEATADFLFLEASAQAFADRAGWMEPSGLSRVPNEQVVDEDSLDSRLGNLGSGSHRPASSLTPTPQPVVEPAGGTSFVVGDRFGNAVACSFTMNGLFGAGRIAPGTGILLAAPPPAGLAISPVAVVIGNENTGKVYFAGAAAEGAVAATALVRVMLESWENNRSVRDALAIGRVHHNGVPDIAFVEDRVPPDVQQALRARGFDLRVLPAMGLVNAFYCADSLNDKGRDCTVGQDPRGLGLSQIAQ